ncbi:MAG: hypothetical protein WC389_15345 [Lutibacter sp.]|jgi:hypothetical protein
MLKYSELSKPQQAIIKAMRQGHQLKWIKDIGRFQIIQTNGISYRVATSTIDALINRHYIEECYRDKEYILYYINIEFATPSNLDAMEKS